MPPCATATSECWFTTRAGWGIGTYLGKAAGQNTMGDVIGHVTDMGRDWTRDHHDRGCQTQAFLPFHCDKTDAVTICCPVHSLDGGIDFQPPTTPSA